MPLTILHIDSSPLSDRSYSRKYSAKIVDGLKAKHPDARIITRDYANNPLPHISAEVLGAFFSAPDKRDAAQAAALKLSDQAVADFLAADILVIGAPMWNFGIPSSLKAWIDHIVRAGVTFRYTPTGVESLVPAGKRAIIASSRGGIYSEGPMKAMDHQESHLESVLQFLGVKDITVIRTEGVNMGEDALRNALATADQQLTEVLRKAA